jgi:hypothetical protein
MSTNNNTLDDTGALSVNEVRLSDGRVARMRDADPAADRRTDLLLLQVGFYRGGRVDPLATAIFRVVLSITHIDDEPVPFPPVPARRDLLRAYAKTFTDDDLTHLCRCYTRLNRTLTPLLRLGRRGRGA